MSAQANLLGRLPQRRTITQSTTIITLVSLFDFEADDATLAGVYGGVAGAKDRVIAVVEEPKVLRLAQIYEVPEELAGQTFPLGFRVGIVKIFL